MRPRPRSTEGGASHAERDRHLHLTDAGRLVADRRGYAVIMTSDPAPPSSGLAAQVRGGGHRPEAPQVAVVRGIEAAATLDRLAPLLGALAAPLARGPWGDALRGRQVGHALHPFLTDLPIGFWTSSLVVDIVGGRAGHDSARRLVGWGLASVLPAAATGLVEWRALGRRDARTGSLHAALNVAATTCYAASWVSRHTGRHRRGVALGVAGATLASASGFLGGHLAIVRKAGSVHPSFDDGSGAVDAD